jgi:hypothetical protein
LILLDHLALTSKGIKEDLILMDHFKFNKVEQKTG